MSRTTSLSVAISSFNRDDKIAETIESLIASDLGRFESIELLIVDDGSPRPVRDVLPKLSKFPDNFTVRLIEQENSGIGATRNCGFRESRNPVILFLDDDIVLPHRAVAELVAAMESSDAAIVFGSYPFREHASESLRAFAAGLYGYDLITERSEVVSVKGLTSGLLLVDKSRLLGASALYRDDLTIPAAEEFEAVARFRSAGVEIFHARHVHAVHNHRLELGWMATQQFKYGMGAAEAFAKHPAARADYDELVGKLERLTDRSLQGLLRRAVSGHSARFAILTFARVLEAAAPRLNHSSLFGLLATVNYWAGYLEGRRRFKA